MKNTSLFRRFLSVVLVLAMVGSVLVPAATAETTKPSVTTRELELTPIDASALESQKLDLNADTTDDSKKEVEHAATDVVRVSIVLDKASTMDAGFQLKGIAANAEAKSYREGLRADQTAMTAKIEKAIRGKLDVKWSLTLVANIISANVRYDQIETIKALDGVKDVFLEIVYEVSNDEVGGDRPNNGSATAMTGSDIAWAAGYTGAGSKIAIIDSGIDDAHISFNGEALEYALKENAEKAGMSYSDYVAKLDLLTAEKVEALKDQLHAAIGSGEAVYRSTKIPYGYNYVDTDTSYIQHDQDTGSEHGSHVSGISAANRYIKVGEEFQPALEAVLTQGVAPDAQLVVMKVFGKSGGAYASDYMVAIEDAIVLGCDSANLSLGSSAVGFGFSDGYEQILDKLVENGMVVSISAGNNGMWYDVPNNANMPYSYLYADDNNYVTAGSPGTYNNSLCVASVNNSGKTDMMLHVGDLVISFLESATYGNEPIATLAGERDYIFFENTGVDGEDNDLLAPYAEQIEGKIVLCQRGDSSFYQKVDAAWKAGAIGCIIYNNDNAFGGMNLTGLDADNHIPAVIITKPDGMAIKAQSTPVTDPESGDVLYYTGKMSIPDGVELVQGEVSDVVEISSFSSYGVPGTLVLKPEILAPGGNIYSVAGYNLTTSGTYEGGHDQYENMSGTSMAAPQIAGMAAVMAQYIRENDLCAKTGLSQRQLINSLLMSTAHPVFDSKGRYWPVIRVGAGLANVNDAINAKSYILMGEDATLLPDSARDGKVKAELGDDPDRTGEYSFSFTLYPMDGAKEFTLGTDLFIQWIVGDGGYGLLQDTATAQLDPGSDFTASYVVNGKTYEDFFAVNADVNKDGKTDVDDAQTILDKLTGALAENAPFDEKVADLDGDKKITTYDAKLLLDSIESPKITIEEPTEITVNLKLADGMKSLIDTYLNSTYIQGYTYVNPVADEEGAYNDVVHSIPILGYYGSWTDAAMLDRTTILDARYGTGKQPYMGNPNINYVTVKDANGNTGIYAGNPYVLEDKFPVDRLALSSNTTIQSFVFLPIRNAATVGFAVTDAEGKLLYSQAYPTSLYAPYYYPAAGSWQNTGTSKYTINKKLDAMGVQEGDEVTVGFYVLPEYYGIVNAKLNGEVAPTGRLDNAGFAKVLDAGVVGDGAGIRYNVTIDNTAPVVTGALQDMLTGNLSIVKAQDNNYIACIKVLDKSGSTVYAEGVPAQTKPNEEVQFQLELGDQTLPDTVVIFVADYAGNETAYEVNLGGSGSGNSNAYCGAMIGFTDTEAAPGSGSRALQLDPEKLYYNHNTGEYDGLDVFSQTGISVRAAEYVDGFVFMASNDGWFYIAELDALNKAERVGQMSCEVYDMAYNYADKTLYALGEDNTIYSVDLATGKMTQVAVVSIHNPASSSGETLAGLAIDDTGTFYGVNIGGTSSAYLYTWKLEDIISKRSVKLEENTLEPVNSENKVGVYFYGEGGALAWDHNTNTLYLAANYDGSSADYDHDLFVIDVETGKGAKANQVNVETDTCAATFYVALNGLFIVPNGVVDTTPTTVATSVTVEPKELDLLKGQVVELTATVLPWTLKDKSVTWASKDESIATVNENGVVTAVAVGETAITATTTAMGENGEPLTAEISVKVSLPPEVELRGVIWDENGKGQASVFKTNHTEDWEALSVVGPLRWGARVGDTVYGSDKNNYIAYDTDTYEVTKLAAIKYIPSDAAEFPQDMVDVFVGAGLDVGPVLAPTFGYFLALINPETGSSILGIDLAYDGDGNVKDDTFLNDPIATIAYFGRNMLIDWSSLSVDYDAPFYVMLTESGAMYYFMMAHTGYYDYGKIGDTGLTLTGVSDPTNEVWASMIYDDSMVEDEEEAGFLYLSIYDGQDECTHLYAIDCNDITRWAETGTFNPDVWPVTGLYEYEPLTDLALKVSPLNVELEVDKTAEISVRIKLGETNDFTAEVKDPEICSFDKETCTITGLKLGETDIVITTVDTNEAGEKLSKTVHVTVDSDPVDPGEYPEPNAEITGVKTLFGFENDPAEDGWTFRDRDMDGYNWTWTEGDVTLTPYDGASMMMSNSYVNGVGALTPDNWAFSPAMDLSAYEDANFAFYAKGQDADWAGEVFAVYAGTSPLLGNMTKITADFTATGDWTKYVASLKNFAGQSEVYVAIRHYNITNMFALDIDNAMLLTADGEPEPDPNPVDPPESSANPAAVKAPAQILTSNFVELGKRISNKVVGSTNAIHGEQIKLDTRKPANETTVGEGKVTVVLKDDEVTTNALLTVNYDPQLLTFVDVTSPIGCKSANVDAENGVITLAYASTKEIAANDILGTLNFTYAEHASFNTKITVTAVERNQNVAVSEDALEIPVVAHDCKISHFTDIEQYPVGTIEHEAIEWAYTHEPQITVGTSLTTFDPDEVVTKGMAVFFLWAAAGKPVPEVMPDVSFTDVKEENYWYMPVMWAYSNRIAVGNGDGTFGAYESCKRAHVLQMFYAAEGKPTLSGENHFNDVTDNWYAPGANWAYEKGIELGDENGNFNADTPCTRVQVVVYLYKYYSQIVEKD